MELKSEELEECKSTQRQGGNVASVTQPKTVAERIGYSKPGGNK